MDRLSYLPDELICHILSFLPTVRSVQTSVVSKRWRFLWAHVPFLEFHASNINSNIITKIVLNHKHDIHTFHLHDNEDLFGSLVEFESWIVYLTTHNIRNLVITQDSVFLVLPLPQCIFTCKTMVDLSLSGRLDIPESGIYLPALKKLKLECSNSQSNESLAHLISGCPVLEDLTFNGKVLGHFCVSSSILTRLVLRLVNADISKLELDTPALRYLRLECYIPDKFSVKALDSLVEADINFYYLDNRHQGSLLYSRNVLALVGELHNVRLLSLEIGLTAMIHGSSFFALGIKFHNLTKLDLSANLGFITSFLENANNLQVLGLTIHGTDDVWMEPKRVPACLLSHLQTVNIRYFRYSEEEFDIIRYILMNAKVLKRMEIHTCWKKKPVAHKRLTLFGRGSQECELVFDGDCLEEAFLESTN